MAAKKKTTQKKTTTKKTSTKSKVKIMYSPVGLTAEYINVPLKKKVTQEGTVNLVSVPLIEGLPLVAHNRPFDEGCLRAVFRTYQMDYPEYEFYDTLAASRRLQPDLENHQLQTVAAACGFQMENHHHALADAEACAWIARELL